MTTPVRVVLADDHPMFRYGLRAVLEGAEEVTVMGEAADGQQLLTVVEETRPDVVLTDLAMPSLDGAITTQRLLQRHPDLGVLVLTMHEDDEMLFGAPRAPAATCSKALTRPRSCGAVLGPRTVGHVHARRVRHDEILPEAEACRGVLQTQRRARRAAAVARDLPAAATSYRHQPAAQRAADHGRDTIGA